MAIKRSDDESRASKLIVGLITLARLSQFELLYTPALRDKRLLAERALQLSELASWTSDVLHRYFHRSMSNFSWPLSVIPELQFEHGRNAATLRLIRERVENQLRGLVRSLQEDAGHGSQFVRVIAGPIFSCVSASGAVDANPLNMHIGDASVQAVLRGPGSTSLDPTFEPTYSLFTNSTPEFSESLNELVPYLWTLAMREANVADTCALSSVEYDGLPCDFYRDMAKQCWDEMRHAEMFLALAFKLIPEVEKTTSQDDMFHRQIKKFKNTGRGLPVPREGGLYEALWNATLSERIVLMQIRTEGPAVAKAKNRQELLIAKRYPEVAEAYRIDELDEISHASIGWRWLKFLYPEDDARRLAIEEADLLRGFLLATSIAQRGDKSVTQLCDELITVNGV